MEESGGPEEGAKLEEEAGEQGHAAAVVPMVEGTRDQGEAVGAVEAAGQEEDAKLDDEGGQKEAARLSEAEGLGEKEEIGCPQCPKTFPDRRKFSSHFLGAHSNPGSCTTCGKFFSSKKQLLRHVKSVHPISPPLKCDECGQLFKNAETLQKHMSCCRRVKQRTRRTQQQCVLCLTVFSSKADLREHVAAEHSRLLREDHSFLRRSKFARSSAKRVRRTWLCTVCHSTFSRSNDLKRHTVKQHSGGAEDQEQPQDDLVCGFKDCIFRCKASIELKRHKEAEHKGERVFPCTVCDKSFTSTSLLYQHKKRTHSEAFLVCPGVEEGAVCGKLFRRKDTLKVHLKSCGAPLHKPWEDIGRTQRRRRVAAKAKKFQEELDSMNGEERAMFLRTVARDHPNLLEKATTMPLTMEDVLQVKMIESCLRF